ncbi:MAG TPA: hypothetical protein VF252_08130 [Gemmatimonadales bacterium]
MRYLFLTALLLAACGGRDRARSDTEPGDTAPTATPAMSAVPDRLLGTWSAQGRDEGATKADNFTITYTRPPNGGPVGTIAFKPGASYNIKIVSSEDSVIVYESEPHPSPTLKTEVVTRTQVRLAGDSIFGTYEAKAAEGGKVLRGEFRAKREAEGGR